jgi:lipopolysaccharide transport system permease protein
MSIALTQAAPDGHLEFRAEHSFASRHGLAVADVHGGLRLWRLAWRLAWLDIRLRYRGSVLGPFWLTLSTGVMVGALGYLYAGIFHTDIHDYLPFLALSMVLWAVLNTTVSEACIAFTEAETVIRSIRMPFTVFALRILMRNALVLGHNILVIVAVFAVFWLWPGWVVFAALPAVALWIVDGLALVLLLGAFCARFRDILPIVNSVMQIAFFVSPVLWKPEQLGRSAWLLPLNPFYDLLEIVRAPLLDYSAGLQTWGAAAGYSGLLLVTAWLFFVRARARIAFWI